jgi:hypothetical protein
MVLREACRPLHVKEIVRRMQTGGFRPETDPKSLQKYLYVAMVRQKRFVKTGPSRFGLTEIMRERMGGTNNG